MKLPLVHYPTQCFEAPARLALRFAVQYILLLAEGIRHLVCTPLLVVTQLVPEALRVVVAAQTFRTFHLSFDQALKMLLKSNLKENFP